MAKTISSLALSRDETLLARGGEAGAAITIWNLASGEVVAHLHGLSRQAHALAFSPDGSRIAAANLWGGLCVWNVADGREVGRKPEESGRKTRSLTYPETAPDALFPVMLGWVGAWLPFEPKPTLFAAVLPPSVIPSALAVLRGRGESWEVLYACDSEVVRLVLATRPEVCRPTKWQEFLSRVPEPADEASRPRSSWRWHETSSGYDGVDLRRVDLLWYHESRPAWAGEWGEEQSLDCFLAEGPRHPIPEPLLIELCQAVRQVVAATRTNEIPSNEPS